MEHADQTSSFTKTKREGIFQVDLRLRPYGTEGPMATSLEQFRNYYGPDGAMHPFEKIALVRLRWIAGDPALGFEVEQLRDRFVHDDPRVDLDALWEVRARQRRENILPGTLKCKVQPRRTGGPGKHGAVPPGHPR